jgi:hypothetical protein
VTAIIAGFLLALGLVLLFGSIARMDRDPYDLNSPLLWIFMIAGLTLAGLGAALLLLH